MRLPDFLIIGAMKAGTTSLYRDLLTNPRVFSPEKEKSHLLREETCTPEGRREYARLYDDARPDQLCGVAPAGYTMLPDNPGIPDRAKRVHGDALKLIYLVREPVQRAVSQHHHESSAGSIACGIDEAVHKHPRLIDYSRYAMQITPWIEAFGREQVMIVHFETYVRNRAATMTEVCEFLGIPPEADRIRDDVVYNKSAAKPVPRGPFNFIRDSGFYQKVVRPKLSPGLKDRLRTMLLPKAAPQHDEPSAETVRHVIDRLGDDPERLRVIMGRDEPLWDMQAVLDRYGATAPSPEATQRT